MRRWALAAGVACAVLLTHSARAQNGATVGGTTMPGQIVGSYSGNVNTVGQRLPQAASPIGQSVSANQLMRPYDPSRPYDVFKGTNIDPKQVLAPLVGPDGRPVEPPDALDKLSEKLKSMLGLARPALPRPPYVPGISRRNRERHQHMWRRD